jgi:HD-like signal output (HDOD) protein
MELKALLASTLVLPSIPRVLALLLNQLERPEPDLKTITQLIGTDPALTVRLMQLSNAPFFKLSGRIHGVSESLAILGLGHVRAMAAAAAADASLRAVPGLNLNQFWGCSRDAARLARSLAGVVRLNQQAAYTSGLLHAIGEVAMHLNMPQALAALNPDIAPLDPRRSRAERRALGFCYAQVGAGFAAQWNFPQAVVDALAQQSAPFEGEAYEPLAGVLHLASWRVRSRELGLPDDALADTFPGPVGDVLGLDIDMVLQQDPIDWHGGRTQRANA